MVQHVSKGAISAYVVVDPTSNKISPNGKFKAGSGIIKCTIQWLQYGQVGLHWKAQLTGKNRAKWGKIYIDADKEQQALNRRDALHGLRDPRSGLSDRQRRQAAATNLDECPGAMFVLESQQTADVEALCASSNQEFGRDLYHALRRAVRDCMVKPKAFKRSDMQWFEVDFKFS